MATELTPRETEIAQLVASGLTNSQISRHLNISEQTVKNHMTAVMAKLQVDDRTQVTVWVLKHNIIDVETAYALMVATKTRGRVPADF